jgi:hypothetical protein
LNFTTYSNRYNCQALDAEKTSALALLTVIYVPALYNAYATVVKINL